MSNNYLICIVGPTAVGKTAMAIRVAKYFKAEILSSDSRQFYRETTIGTAKPSLQELAEVKHHFIDCLSIQDTYSAGDFERDALQMMQSYFSKHSTLVMVGGSGLYIKAVLEGLDHLPKANEKLRTELNDLYQKEGIASLRNLLQSISKERYEQTELNNPQRIMRAIEIAQSESLNSQPKSVRNFIPVIIGLDMPRELLYQRINQRVDQMVKTGLEKEAMDLLSFKDTYALRTVGYAEWYECAEGKFNKDEAISRIKQHTRNYAKRQMTWFRKVPHLKWFAFDDEKGIIATIESEINQNK